MGIKNVIPYSLSIAILACLSSSWCIFPLRLLAKPIAPMEKTSVSSDVTQSLFTQGLIDYQKGTLSGFQSAQESWEKALKLWQKQGDRAQEAITRNFLGLVYENLGEYEKSQVCYQKLLILSRLLKDTQTEASTLNAIARLQSRLGDYQKALENLNLALPLWQKIKFKTGEITTLNEIALVYFNLGEFEQAIIFYNQALELAKNAGNQANLAGIYHNLSQVYLELEDFEQALEIDKQALALWDNLIIQLGEKATIDLKRGKAASLNNIAFLESKLSDFPLALTTYQQSLNLWQAIGDRSGEASTLNNLGDIYLLQNQPDRAQKYYQQALTLRQTIGDRPKETISRYSLALVNQKKGNLLVAKQQIEAAIDIIENIRSRVTSQDLRTSFLASKQDYYRLYIDLLMQLNEQYPKQGWNAKALIISERSKARSLLEILAQSSGKLTQGISPKLLTEKENIQQQLNQLEKQRIQLFNGQFNESQKLELDQKIDQLLQQYRQNLDKISISSPNYANLTQPKPPNLAQIQSLLDPNTILLEYALGSEKSYLWAVTSRSLSSYTLPSEKVLSEGIKTFRESFLFPSQRVRRSLAVKTSYILKNQILPPQLALKNQRILIVADGALQYLPFGALSNSEKVTADLTYLIDDHELVNLPSAAVLGMLRQENRDRKPASKPLAVFADPVFNISDDRLKNLGLKTPPITTPELVRSARESGVLFDRLPFTQSEAQQILALVSKSNSLQELGFSATRDRFFNSNLNQYRFIHFATHGLLNSQNPQLSGLVLSLFNKQGQSVNGFLRLYDIFNLQLRAELVVLSACQTGLGKEVKGEGMIGLTRGFIYAGARRVVVSLWSVDDQATSLLMTDFYQGMLQKKLSPAAALREAQKAIKADKDLASPYYWAAFTLQGEWQ